MFESTAPPHAITRPVVSSYEARPGFFQLGVFKIGGRDQRVRLFFNDGEADLSDYKVFSGWSGNDDYTSLEYEKIKKDPLNTDRANPENCLGATCESDVSAVSNRKYVRDDMFEWKAIALNPQLLLCTAKALEQIKRVGDANPNDMKTMQIDEVNIIIYASNKSNPDNFGLERSDVAQIP